MVRADDNRLTNVTNSAFRLLAASIYNDVPGGSAVPLLELCAHGVLVLTITAALIRIASQRRGRKEETIVDPESWEPLVHVDVTARVFTGVAVMQLLVALAALVLMAVPIEHTGAFAAAVYACARRPSAR